MNIFVLVAMDKESYSEEELRQNAFDSNDESLFTAADIAAFHVANDVLFGSMRFDHWLDLYFVITGEDRQDYINAIREGNNNE